MKVMYPLQSQNDYTELKYSLRSIEKYLSGDYEVIVVGDKMPDWLNNVTQIEVSDIPGRKQLSIKRKILAALEYAEEVFFMNDDVFLLQPTVMENYPYYYWADLKKYHAESGSTTLLTELEKMGKPTKNYDGHFPLIYGQDFKQVSEQFNPDGIIKSMYANYLEIEGELKPDCKLLPQHLKNPAKNFIKERPCFSTGNYTLNVALPLLKEMFPEPSKYEI